MRIRSNSRVSISKGILSASLLMMATFFVSSCQKRQATTINQPISSPSTNATSTPESPSTATEVHNYTGTGVVTKVVRENPYDKSLASVELNHGEIVGLMPAMRMEFFVKNVSLLDGIKLGDLVDFTIEVKGPTEVISEIKKK